MKFSKLPKEKRNHLVLVVVGTIATLAVLGFGLIKAQYATLTGIAEKKAVVEKKMEEVDSKLNNATKLQAELDETMGKLVSLETNMAPYNGEYLWMINTIRTFRSEYAKVEIPQFGPSAAREEMNLFPKFPYQQATLSVAGKAHYHDLGVFVSDFENRFPHMRVLNLTLKLNPEAGQNEREKLAFNMDIVSLVRSAP